MGYSSIEEMIAELGIKPKTNSEKWLIPETELDDTQYRILNRNDIDFMVDGCAGSGKTILAIYRLKQLIKNNKGSYLFIVYTITLKEFIINALEDEDDEISDVDVYYEKEFIRLSKKDSAKDKTYDYIIIDEVQDLKDDFIESLKALCNKQIICLGDDAQQIYSKHNNGATLKSIAGKAGIKECNIEYLNKNYRVSKSIAKLAGKIIDDNGKLESSCVNDFGIKPIVKKFNSLYEELDYIVDFIDEEGLTDVAILVHRNKIVRKVARYLRNNGIEVEYKDENINEINFRIPGIKILTYHSSKGLEFDSVFLPHCEISVEEHNYREALYVACTRAKKRLFISYSGTLSRFIKNIDNKEV